jgi:hypothetical protein
MSFSGNDACDWFMHNMEGVVSLDTAIAVGNQLLELNVIHCVTVRERSSNVDCYVSTFLLNTSVLGN